MSVQSSAPPSSRMVYTLLIVAGVLAAAIGASTVGYIAAQYITRVELREPVPLDDGNEGDHASLPAWIMRT